METLWLLFLHAAPDIREHDPMFFHDIVSDFIDTDVENPSKR